VELEPRAQWCPSPTHYLVPDICGVRGVWKTTMASPGPIARWGTVYVGCQRAPGRGAGEEEGHAAGDGRRRRPEREHVAGGSLRNSYAIRLHACLSVCLSACLFVYPAHGPSCMIHPPIVSSSGKPSHTVSLLPIPLSPAPRKNPSLHHSLHPPQSGPRPGQIQGTAKPYPFGLHSIFSRGKIK